MVPEERERHRLAVLPLRHRSPRPVHHPPWLTNRCHSMHLLRPPHLFLLTALLQFRFNLLPRPLPLLMNTQDHHLFCTGLEKIIAVLQTRFNLAPRPLPLLTNTQGHHPFCTGSEEVHVVAPKSFRRLFTRGGVKRRSRRHYIGWFRFFLFAHLRRFCRREYL